MLLGAAVDMLQPKCTDTTRRFLLDTFGRDVMCSGTGVLDVAGGKGDIAFELVNLNRIPATLVEPRPACLHKRLLWLQACPLPLAVSVQCYWPVMILVC